MVAALRAMGIEPFDTAGDHVEVSLPRRPFDPVLALVLAGYAFRAYRDPPASAYYEMFAAPVKGSAVSGLNKQFVYTEFAYTDSALFASRADGLFMLQVKSGMGMADSFVVAQVNSAVVVDVLRKKNATVLRLRDSYTERLMSALNIERDSLVLYLFKSQRGYEEGVAPSHMASLSLSSLIESGLETGTGAHGEETTLQFVKVTQADKNHDFFHFSLLPSDMQLPFQRDPQTAESESNDDVPAQGESVAVQVTFVPFRAGREAKQTATASSLARKSADDMSTMGKPGALMDTGRLLSSLAKELEPGRLPDPEDWSRLAHVARSLPEQVGTQMGFERTKTVTEKLAGSLFIESLATDTEVWLFHDEDQRNIIVSFRGTEQVKWMDFFTDAQLFLQRWTPGQEVNLNVDTSQTVGLADFVPSILPSADSSIAEDASAVHYGFLRAYLSVRDALLRGINLLSNDLSEGYSLYFTGHSLGGALATLAAADFQALHLFHDYNVTCMSFGAPKVGNLNFVRLFNKLVPNAFRIVNDADLVSRMPRSLPSGTQVGRYKHSGRTVLINEIGNFWIEGHHAEGYDRMISMEDPFRDRYKNIQDLIAFEQKLWSEMLSGRSLRHHMEDSYFVAMQNVLRHTVNNRLV